MKTSIRERRHAPRPTAPVNALPIPAACQQLNGDINESNMELQDLQTEMKGATRADRARILREIRTVTAQLEAQQTEMDHCLALHAPPDGAVLKGKAKPEVYVIFGGAKFWIPTPEELIEYYGGWANVEVVRQPLIDLLPNIPAEGTLLRERSSAPVYVVAQGRTRWIPDPQTFNALGFDRGRVAVIPDASLAHNGIPNGMALPRFLPVQVGTNIGLGGGGSMYAPSISPWFPNLMFLACDMGGLYRSTNNGQIWQMIDGRDMRGSTRCAAAFHPDGTNHPDTVHCFAKGRDIRISNDRGLTWGPRIQAPAYVGDPDVSGEVTALAVDPNPPASSTSPWRLYAGTDTQGAFYSDTYSSGAPIWTAITLDPPPQDIVGFVFLKDPAPGPSRYLYFVATRNAVYHLAPTGAWTKIIANLPSPLTIRSFSGGVDIAANQVALYVVTPSPITGTAMGASGPYACVQPGGSPWTSPSWTQLNNATLDFTFQTPNSDAACQGLTQYHWISAVPSNPSHVYVTACGTKPWPEAYPPGTPKPPSHHSGVYKSQNGGLAWEHVYYFVDKQWLGNPPNPYPPIPAPDPRLADANITGGWVDWDSSWGSGGPAQTPDLSNGWHGGFCVGQQNGVDCAIFVNDQASYVTFDAAGTWQESYTKPAATPDPSQPWQSIGLEVTTTWQYYIDPHDPQSHYLCYTDIGCASSTDAGKTWHHNGNAYQDTYQMSNAYELAFDPLVGKQIWAAGARQHDIPRYTQLAGFFSDKTKTHWFDLENGGAVLFTTDGGTTWTDLTTANMSNGLPRKVTLSAFQANPSSPQPMVPPVVSLVVDQAFRYPPGDWRNRRLWASLFGAGVYYSEDGGQNWQPRSAGLPTDNQHVYRLEFRPDGTFQADGVTPNGLLYCAVVGKNVPTGNDPTAPPPGDYISGLYASQDRGQSWSNITPFASIQPPLPGPILCRLVDYAVHPTDPNQAYICTDQTQSGVDQASSVYQGTKSAGTWTWTQTMSVANVGPSAWWPWLAAFAPFFDPSDVSGRTVYVGTLTHGFWVTTDAGTNWNAVFTDVPFLPSHRVTFDPGNPGHRYLTTYGGGAWAEIGANPSPATWTKLAPAAAPSGRIAATMGFDGGNLVLFGGYNNGSILGDTWRWDGKVWTDLTLTLARSPTARWSAAIAYDLARGNLMLFSGSSSVQELDDTWTWSAGTWTQAMPTMHPPGRVDATMAFDGTGVILFGGISTGTTLLNDTWRWDGHSWAPLQPGPAPPVRRLAVMCYDAARGQVVLFGGNNDASSLSSLGDTWLWNGTVWTPVAGSGPPPRFGAVMTYNPARRAVVLFGGENGQGALSDTWTWDGVNWTQQSPSSAPASFLYGGFAFDVNRSGCVLFSGWGPGGVYWTDTWLYQ